MVSVSLAGDHCQVQNQSSLLTNLPPKSGAGRRDAIYVGLFRDRETSVHNPSAYALQVTDVHVPVLEAGGNTVTIKFRDRETCFHSFEFMLSVTGCPAGDGCGPSRGWSGARESGRGRGEKHHHQVQGQEDVSDILAG